MINFFLIVFFAYILAILETSFFPHFYLTKIPFVIILVSIIFLLFLEKKQKNFSVIFAFFSGLFLDFFSEKMFGFWLVILVSINLILKFFLEQYVRIPTFKGD